MRIQYDFTNLLKSAEVKLGVGENELEALRPQVKHAQEKIKQNREQVLGFYSLPEKDTGKIKEFTKRAQDKYDTMVVLGIGGSALGNRALYQALKAEKNLDKKLVVLDNVDPLQLHEALSGLDLKRTVFNCITKSGTTAETMSEFMIITDLLQKHYGNAWKERMVITTDAHKGFLRQVINQENMDGFEVPDNVGGRFSVLTDVGLVSCAFAGLDVDELLAGAGDMRALCLNDDIFANPAHLNGLLHYLYMQKGMNISVMMPYANHLYDLADWYRQLWAESLGKRVNISGKEVFVGPTPVKALGTTDQHSQVQLYVEGPYDKVITLMQVDNFAHDYTIPDLYNDRPEVSYLCGKKLSRLLNTECLATEIALTRAGRPNCLIKFPVVNERTLGQFVFMYEAQTVFTGYLMQIDPLDQPGVEAGKIATYAMMGKKGFEEEKAKTDAYIQNKEKMGKII